jgi:imidazolonepropionase-like amidohydrolase
LLPYRSVACRAAAAPPPARRAGCRLVGGDLDRRWTCRREIVALGAQLAAAGRQLGEAGITIICGTDAGVGPPKPHHVLPYGIARFADVYGYSPVEALRATTSLAAQACGLGARKGCIAPGFDADLLAVHGDPFTDLAVLRAVKAVFRAGHPVPLTHADPRL